MLITPLLATGLIAAHVAGVGLAVSPAAVDAAQPQTTYALHVTNTGHHPELVTPSLRRATEAGGHCVDSAAIRPAWARFSDPTAFRLRPGARRTVRLTLATPPAGRYELIAAFTTQPQGHGQVVTVAGVGTAIRTSQPGNTAIKPCPLAAPKPGGPGVLAVAGLGLAGALVALVIALLWLRRRRPGPGTHAA